MRFQGDTLGIDVSLAPVLPIVLLGFAAAMAWWLVRRRSRAAEPPPWTRTNFILLGLAAILLPVQYLLLREPHGPTDAAGVLVTIAQWLLISIAFRPFYRS